jgi:hypothetical protein
MTTFEDGQVGSTMEIASDFSAWTSTEVDAGCSLSVDGNYPHHGTNNMRAVSTATAADYARANKTFAGAAICYARCYVEFVTLAMGVNHRLQILTLDDGGFQEAVSAGVRNTGGTLYWCLFSWEGGVINSTDGANTPATGTVYAVEIERDVTNNTQEMWINDVSEVNTARAITSNSTRLRAGIHYQSSANANDLGMDCWVVDTSKIGLEPTVSIPVMMHHYGHHINKIIRG